MGAGGEVMYDQRLFNQEQGMGSGLASDDTYNLYDKALFADRGTGLFRPTAAAADEDAPAGGAPHIQPYGLVQCFDSRCGIMEDERGCAKVS